MSGLPSWQLDQIKEIARIRQELERLQSIKPQFTILTPAELENITSDQANYALGNYDIIFLVPTAARIIHGITNGFKGRFLIIQNSGSFNLSFTHQSGTATLGNRILTGSGATVVIATRQSAIFSYYQAGAAGSTTGNWVMHTPAA